MCDRRTAGYGLFVLTVLFQPARAQADPSWADRLRSEALPAWDAELADALSVQGTARFTRRTDVTTEFVVMFKANTECALYTEKRNNSPTNLYAYNPKYTFRLRSTDERGWALVSVHVGDPEKDEMARDVRKRLAHNSRIAGYGLRLAHNLEPLARYVRGPTTRVVSVAPTTWKGADVVEVKLDITPATKDDEIQSITSLHDPNQKWRTVRTSVTGRRGESTFVDATEYEYTPGPGGILKSTSERGIWTTDGKPSRADADRVFDFKRLTTLPDTSEFTLSAYGLPEPVGVEWPKRRSGWLWFAWAGAASVVVGLAFVALKRRAARRQAAAPPTPS